MAATNIAPTPLLGSSLIRRWSIELNSGTLSSPTWIRVNGIGNFKFGRKPVLKDDTDFDSGGFASSTKTADGWELTFKVMRKPVAATSTTYDAGQELLRARAALMGPPNSTQVQWYENSGDTFPRVEAYRGLAAVSWEPDGGAQDDLDIVSVTLTGQGALNSITNPASP